MTTSAQRKLAELRLAEIRKAKQKRVRWFKWTGFSGKTLWDWLNLLGVLAIPLVVVGATIALGIIQADLAQKQHEFDQQRALDQQQATILQTYIDNIQDLLLNHNLLKSKPDGDAAILARARTLTALQGLNGSRKGGLVQFLYEAHLIGFLDKKYKQQPPIIDLIEADLSGANLSRMNLFGVDLSSADLSGANLSGALLDEADLFAADLGGANLSYANLLGANLNGVNLRSAHLVGALYNSKPIQSKDVQGNPITVQPTQWPQGFDPKVAGATCSDC